MRFFCQNQVTSKKNKKAINSPFTAIFCKLSNQINTKLIVQIRLFKTKMLCSPLQNTSVAHWWAMAHRLKTIELCFVRQLNIKNRKRTEKTFSKLDFQKLTKILINQCYFRSTKMLAQLADLRLCALMSLRLYVPASFCSCALMSAQLCPAPFCLRPYVVNRAMMDLMKTVVIYFRLMPK